MANFFEAARGALLSLAGLAEDVFIPPVCGHCGRRRFSRAPLCLRCLKILRGSAWSAKAPLPGWEGGIYALYRMTPPLQSLIRGFKYRHFRRDIRFACKGLRLYPAVSELGESDAIVPVPMHSARRRERGYNQAEIIAREISKACGRPVVRALARIRPTVSQTRLGEKERAENPAGAFKADPEKAKNLKILLVDDVCTTGSTLTHCREELLRAGAAGVEAFALAWVKRLSPGGHGEKSGISA